MSHVHMTIVTLFVVFLIVKWLLLIMNKAQNVKSLRILDMVFGILVIGSGIVMIVERYNHLGLWFGIKMGLIVVAIPLNIVGSRKRNKLLVTLALLIFLFIIGYIIYTKYIVKTA